jgi:hypothetical protein
VTQTNSRLSGPLVLEHGGMIDLETEIRLSAEGFRQADVIAQEVERLAEVLALSARFMDEDSSFSQADGLALARAQCVHASLGEWLAYAFSKAQTKHEVMARAIHLLDVAERLALHIYVPELPKLNQKSDRSGDAARQVGVARHLRG